MKPMVLIVGRESLIGESLISFCKKNEHPFVATTRRNGQFNDTTIYLDLTDDPYRWRIPAAVECAVLCTGLTGLAACENNQVLSHSVNVDGMVRLIEHLQNRGIKIIYLSTSQVFDGNNSCVATDRPQNPTSVYGLQKTMVEKYLMAEEKNAVIVRMTKVLHPGTGRVGEWIKALQQNKTITPFLNMVLSPIHMDQVVNTLIKLIEGEYSGIFHLSGEKDISYADMGYYLVSRLGLSPEMVSTISADPSLLAKGALPKHTTLDTTRTRHELKIEARSIWHVIDQVFQDTLHL
jgi:dTDP-4-dehydrorhamnose reductase